MSTLHRALRWAAFSLGLMAILSSNAPAQCPPLSTPTTTVTTLPSCCDYGLAIKPCGVDTTRVYLDNLVPPSVSVTQDPANSNYVFVTINSGSFDAVGFGACIGAYCGPGPSYNWTPYKSVSHNGTNYSFFTYNYPSSAWVGGDKYHVDVTKLPSNQCSISSSWSDSNGNTAISDQKETFSMGPCVPTAQPKLAPKPKITQCPVRKGNMTPSSTDCKPNGQMDPVDPYSGDYYYSEEDLMVKGIVPLKAVRSYYSSLKGFTGPFGVGTYLAGYNYKLTLPLNPDNTVNSSPNQTVLFDEGNGLTVPFTNGTSGGLVFRNDSTFGTAGTKLTVHVDGSGNYTDAIFEAPDNTKFSFVGDVYLSQSQDRAGNTIIFTRDSNQRLLTAASLGRSLNFEYNASGLISRIYDNSGREVKYTYDTNDQLIDVKNPQENYEHYTWYPQHQIQTAQDYRGYVRLLNYYNADGSIKQQSLMDGVSLSSSGIFVLDYTGPLTRRITDPNGNKQTFIYNTQGKLIQSTDGLNHSTSTTYSSSIFSGSPTGRYIEVTDALGHTKHWDLNSNNDVTAFIDALNHTTSTVYDTTWPTRPASITNPLGRTYNFTYNSNGNLSKITDPASKTTTFTYNTHGQPLTITNALSKTTTYTYSTDGDLLTVTDPLSHTAIATYDSIGNRLTFKDPKNQTTTYTYDLLNNLNTITDPLSKVTQITWDANSNLYQVKNPRSNLTTYFWDRKGRNYRMSLPGTGLSDKSYDHADRLVTYYDFKNNQHQYTYDAANRVTQERVYTGSSWQNTYNYTYDDADRLTNIQDGSNNWTYTYDNANRTTSLAGPQGTVTYTYDGNDNRKTMSATGHTQVDYDYDLLDRLTSVTQGSNTFGFSYDDIDRRIGVTRPNAVNTLYTYDDANRLTQIHHLKTGSVDDQFDFTFDDNGNILTSSYGGGTRSYSYDAMNRLTQMVKTVAIPGETLPKQIDWTYDEDGNITQRKKTADDNTVTTYGFTYDNKDHMTQMSTNGGSAVTYTYDANGSLTGDGTRTFTWNGMNQLSQMTSGGVTSSFTYDPLGRRTTFTQGSTTKTYFYDNLNQLSDGTNKFLNGAGIDEPLQITNGSAVGTYLADQIGSISRIMDASASTLGQYSYNPYGRLLSSSTPMSGNSFTYTAREDDGTGLMYYRARYYDSNLNIFISQDPLGEAQRYVGGNPIAYFDPYGTLRLPADPSGLPDGWVQDPSHQYPNGSRWKNAFGDTLDFHERHDTREGKGPGDHGGGPHWHYNRDKNPKSKSDTYKPGDECPTQSDNGDVVQPFTPIFPVIPSFTTFPAPVGVPSYGFVPAWAP